MINRIDDLSLRAVSKLAGAGYLIVIAAGIFAHFAVRGSLVVQGDAAATADNILASETLFRMGLISDLIMTIVDVSLAWLLYLLLKPVSRNLALFAAFLRLAMDAVLGLNMLNHFGALYVLGGADYLAAFTTEQLQALSLMFMNLHDNGYLISQFFFGPHQIILGWLVYKSVYIPRLFGVLLILAGFGYLVESFTMFIAPAYESITVPGLAVAGLSELAFCIWLLFRGAKEARKIET